MSVGSLDLGTLHLKMKGDRTELKADLAAAKRDADDSGEAMGRSWWQILMGWMKQIGQLFRRGGRDAADGFWRDAQGRLHDHKGKFVAEGKELGEALGEGAGQGAGNLLGLFGKLGGLTGSLSGGMGTLALVVLALGAAAIFTVPLVYALGGAIAALPALTTGGIAALATLLIGFSGITDAFKKHASVSGAVVDRARQIALAERRLTDAQEEALAAQLALTEARDVAAERYEDLDRSLRGAKLDEKDATDALTAAEKELARAQKSKDAKRIEAATREYERAKLRVEEVTDRVDDLSKEQEKATAAGVEGSREVQAALDRQRRATREVEDATYDMGKAGKAAGGGAAQETTKLARSALAAVAAIKSLKGWYEILRLDVQEHLFAGVDREILGLSAAWGPTVRTRLVGMADMFNRLFKSWAQTSRKPEFIANIATGWESIERLIGRVGTSIATKGLDAFGKLSAGAAPFLDMIGDKIGGLVDHFGEWIDRAEKSGALQRFFDKATTFFGQIWDLGGDVIGLLGEFFSIWEDSASAASTESTFDAIRSGLHDLREWLKDPENRENLRNLIDGIILFGAISMQVLGWLTSVGIPLAWSQIRVLAYVWDLVAFGATKAKDWIVREWGKLTDWFGELPKKIGAVASVMWDGPVATSKAAFNAIAGLWNRTLGSFSFTVPEWVGPPLGGHSIGFPKIPLLAHGGLVRATPGGRPVVVGEGGDDEIVSPVDQMRRIVAEELDRVLAGGVDGIHVDKVEVKAYSDRFSLRQVQSELAMHGAH